ncbi:MAG: tetratricopeptide repeat protein [Bacteroidales bacterium]|nr:tetratricopeptide repeat protein [Bacteroidales bacterium]
MVLVCLSLPQQAYAQTGTQQEQLAIEYFKNQEFEKAIELFAELYKRQPNNYYYSYYLQCLMQTQSYKEAEQLVNRQMKRFPQMQRYGVDLGLVYEAEGNSTKAKKQFENCIQKAANQIPSLKELAAAFIACGLPEQAISCYEQIRKTSGDPLANAFEMAGIYSQRGLYDKALWEYLLWVKTANEHTATLENILTTWLADDPEHHKRDLIERGLMTFTYKEPDQLCYANLLLWFSMQEGRFSEALKQAVAIDKRFKGEGKPVYDLANIATENGAYGVALDAYHYILKHYNEFSLCYEAAQTGSLWTRYRQITATYPPKTGEIRQLSNELDTFFTHHPLQDNNIDLYLTHVRTTAFGLKNTEKAKSMLQTAIRQPKLSAQSKARCKLLLGDIFHAEEEVWEATLLYSQVEKDFPNDTLGQTAKFKNAKLAFYMNEFEWAKAQLDVLRAATSKLIANDAMYLSLLISDNESDDSLNLPLSYYAKADYLIENQEYEKASSYLDSIRMLSASHQLEDDILYRKAEIAFHTRQFETADRLLEQLVTEFPYELLTDDALFLRARIKEQYLNDPLTAMDLYQKLLKEHPDSLHASAARKQYKELRTKTGLTPGIN